MYRILSYPKNKNPFCETKKETRWIIQGEKKGGESSEITLTQADIEDVSAALGEFLFQ